MKVINGISIGDAHEKVVKLILLEGEEIMTKHGLTLEYPEPITVHLENPLNAPMVSECSKFTSRMCEIYFEQMSQIIPKTDSTKDFDYNVGNRWFDYPRVTKHGLIFGDGDEKGFNQIQEIIMEEFQKDKSSRRAIICSLSPEIDAKKKHIPCIVSLQFLIRYGKLNLIVYIRSNDMLSAWGADAFGLAKVQKSISGWLDISPGYMETISVSAHLYPQRDGPELMNFRRKLNV
jgi:thymidylate synthase